MLHVATAAMAGALFVSAHLRPAVLAPGLWASTMACAPSGRLLRELAGPLGWPQLAIQGGSGNLTRLSPGRSR